MSSLFESIMEIGLGTLTLTKERAEKLVEQLVKIKEVPEETGHEVLQKLMEKGRETREELGKVVQREVDEALDKADIARSDDVERLAGRLTALEERLRSLEELLAGLEGRVTRLQQD